MSKRKLTMGGGASVDNARATVASMLMNKPADASDIVDIAAAKAEIVQLREMAKKFQDHIMGTCNVITWSLYAACGTCDVIKWSLCAACALGVHLAFPGCRTVRNCLTASTSRTQLRRMLSFVSFGLSSNHFSSCYCCCCGTASFFVLLL